MNRQYIAEQSPQVRVGVGVFILRDGKFLMQQRQGSHGADTWRVSLVAISNMVRRLRKQRSVKCAKRQAARLLTCALLPSQMISLLMITSTM